MAVNIINVDNSGTSPGCPGTISGNERHYNSGSEAAGFSHAVNPGDVIDCDLGYADNSGAYGDGGGGRWRLYTGPTANQASSTLLADTGLKTGSFGSTNYGGTVPSGHYFAWFTVLDNIWYRQVKLNITAAAYVTGLNFSDADAQSGWPGATGGGGASRHYNSGSLAFAPPYAVSPGDAINQDSYSTQLRRPYGDTGNGRWYIYTGPTSDQVGGAAQWDSGSFGVGYYGSSSPAFIVPAGHNYVWFAFQNNIWYEVITVTRSPAPAAFAFSQSIVII